MEKFGNKYRIPSARMGKWDYGWAGAYFITICTKNQIYYFGDVFNKSMMCNEIGEIVQHEIQKTPTIRPDMHITLGEFVVMPNHVHMILIIGDNEYNTVGGNAMHANGMTNNQFEPQRKNVASVVRGIKSAVTMAARKFNPTFEWQSRFYEHVIRNNDEFHAISEYIKTNPQQWDCDTLRQTQ